MLEAAQDPIETPCTEIINGKACPGVVQWIHQEGYTTAIDCQECKIPQMVERAFSGLDHSKDLAQEIKNNAIRLLDTQIETTPSNKGVVSALLEMPLERRKVWLEGAVGSGKTFLLMHALKRCIEATGESGLFLPESVFLKAWRSQYITGLEGWGRRILERAEGVSWLLLDDFGQGRDLSPKAIDALDTLIMRRYESCRSILLSTNLRPKALIHNRGARSVSRLVELCGRPLVLSRGGWRGKNA